MARMIRMFLIICCLIVQTLQYENGHRQPKTLHVYGSQSDQMRKPAVFTADSLEKNVSLKRQKRDSNAPSDKGEINKNITTAVSWGCVICIRMNIFFYFNFGSNEKIVKITTTSLAGSIRICRFFVENCLRPLIFVWLMIIVCVYLYIRPMRRWISQTQYWQWYRNEVKCEWHIQSHPSRLTACIIGPFGWMSLTS